MIGLRHFLGEIGAFCHAQAGNAAIAPWVASVAQHAKEWEALTREIGMKSAQNAEEIGAAAVDYLFYSGYTTTNGGFTDFSALALPFNHTPTSSNPYPSLSDHKLYRSQAVLHY